MSANQENEEIIRQLESRLQKLESQRKLEEHEQEKIKRAEQEANKFLPGYIAMCIIIGGIVWIMLSTNFGGIRSLPSCFGGIIILFLWIVGMLLLIMINKGKSSRR